MLKHTPPEGVMITIHIPDSFGTEIKMYAEAKKIPFAEAAKIALGMGLNQIAIDRQIGRKHG